MTGDEITGLVRRHLQKLCVRYPDRSVGSVGNLQATEYFAKIADTCGFSPQVTEFTCLDWKNGKAAVRFGEQEIPVSASPYSLPCDVHAVLVEASTVSELEELDAEKRILLLHGEIAAEPIMPKNYTFYNPEEHRRLLALLEDKNPAAIISATARNPMTSGAIDPPPMFEDGDFHIPSVYTDIATGRKLSDLAWERVHLQSDCQRIPARGEQVVAGRGTGNKGKIVFSCHIDSKKGSPGALDNAGGTAVLLTLMELLKEYQGDTRLEIVPFNGEDYWAASGEMVYLQQNPGMPGISLCINLDGVGDRDAPAAYSFYDCSAEIEDIARKAFTRRSCLVPGDPWVQGDHSVFVMNGVPAIALITAQMTERWATVAHTPNDRIDLLDPAQLVEIALTLAELAQQI